jgi:hypothetical protein
MADGHLNKCKECTKTDVKKHRKENDSVREYDRKRGNRQSKEDVQRYRSENPRKWEAHKYINNSVKKGLIVKPELCESCGMKPISAKSIHGHHDDYSKPDVVRWLCAKCHHRWHAEHGEALNP